MEKVNLFETNKKQKTKQTPKPTTPMNPSAVLNNTSKSNQSNPKPTSTKPKCHVDLNYVKQERVLNFYKLKGTNSKITCHGRPTPKQVRSMRQMYNVNYCLTLQKQKENPLDVLKYCQDNGIEWQLIELDGANVAYMKKKEVLARIVDGLFIVCQKLLNENLVLFIHCAAGLHRTGTVVYSLLRVFGETAESAFAALGVIREDSQREVGNERIRIAETVIYPELLKKLKSNNIDLNCLIVAEENEVSQKNEFVRINQKKMSVIEENQKKGIRPNGNIEFNQISSEDKNLNENVAGIDINKQDVNIIINEICEINNNENRNGHTKIDDKMKKIFDDLDC